jgi:CheY-like chemotaxis protein
MKNATRTSPDSKSVLAGNPLPPAAQELRKERLTLLSVLCASIDASRPRIEASGRELALDFPDEDLYLDADPQLLSKAFATLLANAARHTPGDAEIMLRAAGAAGFASIHVKSGRDIGLTSTRRLVQLHGGTLEAASDESGHGCEFIVRLPLAEASALAQPLSSRLASPDRPLDRSRVLVVDDNHDAADSVGMLLRFLGAEVMIVHDGPSALEAMPGFRPCVVLLDLGMPGMGGLEVARRMRKDPRMREATLVALTGWGQQDDRLRTSEAGFDHHLVKPSDAGTLAAIIGNVRDEGRSLH